MAAHQAPPSLGFSRQEHWSGLPFPSPVHESEKWKWSHVRPSVTPRTTAFQAPPSMGFSRQEYWSGVPLPSPDISLLIRSDQSLSHVQLFATPWIAARQASLFIINSWSSLRLTSIESVFIHIVVQNKLAQHCKAIILQLKKFKKLNQWIYL